MAMEFAIPVSTGNLPNHGLMTPTKAKHLVFLLFGHTHWPLLKTIGNTTIVNPGGLGQPKDGDSSAPYAVMQDGSIELRRISYPIDLTVAAYANLQLASTDVENLIAVLRSGGTLRPA
jgi:hypothetical protein